MEIAITVAVTVPTGISIFVFGQVFVVLFLERMRTQARCIEDIAQALVMYAQVYSDVEDETTPTWRKERADSASTEFRRLAALLRANARTLRYYKFWQRVHLVLPQDSVIAASKELVGLSNSCHPRDIDQIMVGIAFSDETVRLLGIDSRLVS